MWRRFVSNRRLLHTSNVNHVSKMKKEDCMPRPECKPATQKFATPKPCSTTTCESKVECVMDFAPYPEGCWREMYDKNNQKYNLILIFGIINFITAVICQLKVGFVPGYPEISMFEHLFECFEEKKK